MGPFVYAVFVTFSIGIVYALLKMVLDDESPNLIG